GGRAPPAPWRPLPALLLPCGRVVQGPGEAPRRRVRALAGREEAGRLSIGGPLAGRS
ncbi:unnamed protein product, partial [Amoebophrya sp. A120]